MIPDTIKSLVLAQPWKTVHQLAQETGVSRSTIQRWRRNEPLENTVSIVGDEEPSEDTEFSELMDSSKLSAMEAKADALRDQALKPGTLEVHRIDMRYWRAWSVIVVGDNLPFPTPTRYLEWFLVSHYEGLPIDMVTDGPAKTIDPSWSTIRRRINSLCSIHVRSGFASPMTPSIRRLMESIKEKKLANRPTKKATPITRARLNRILVTCGDDFTGIRDRALFLFAWCSGGRRASEIATLEVKDLERVATGFHATIRPYKGRKEVGDVPVYGEAFHALNDWLEYAEIETGAVFRSVNMRPLTRQTIRSIICKRATEAGLTGNITSHSLRHGFAEQCRMDGVHPRNVMALMLKSTVDGLLGYGAAPAHNKNPASRLYS